MPMDATMVYLLCMNEVFYRVRVGMWRYVAVGRSNEGIFYSSLVAQKLFTGV